MLIAHKVYVAVDVAVEVLLRWNLLPAEGSVAGAPLNSQKGTSAADEARPSSVPKQNEALKMGVCISEA